MTAETAEKIQAYRDAAKAQRELHDAWIASMQRTEDAYRAARDAADADDLQAREDLWAVTKAHCEECLS
jgi:hypothetical protein